jgi:UDP-3-O-[3-hydroxymyristoyl] N-acetylglucosamine deacetylase
MLSGHGLHSGSFCRVFFHPAEGPVRFLRQGQYIPATLESVVATPRCTVLGNGGARLALVEHLLAALLVSGWWQGLVIEASSEELPILDGSAAPWLEPIGSLGPPPPRPRALELKTSAHWQEGDSSISLKPGKSWLEVAVDYDHPAIGRQSWSGPPENYPDLLNARTFGFLSELEALRAAGLAAHASLENAIVFDNTRPMQPLRHPQEPVRHKALDALGDFFLLGRPVQGRLEIKRGSHQAHVAFMRQLTALPAELV